MSEVYSKRRSGYVGVIWNGSVVGSESKDIHKARHENLVEKTTHARFRYADDWKAILWNSFPPTNEDMILVEEWLLKRGASPKIHRCCYVYNETLPTILSHSPDTVLPPQPE